MYRLVMELGFDVSLVSSEAFESKEMATQRMNTDYAQFPGFAVMSQEEVDTLATRKVLFGKREA